MAQTFTRKEIEAHKRDDDLWIVMHNKVYNLTSYLEEHPGGKELLQQLGGLDATEAFEEVGHSDEARETVEAFLVGEISAEDAQEDVEIYRPNFEVTSRITEYGSNNKSSSILGKATVLAVVLGVGASAYYGKSSKVLSRTSVDQLKGLFSLQMMTSGGFWNGVTTATIFNGIVAFIGVNKFKEHFMEVNKVHTKFTLHKAPTPEVLLPKKLLKKPILHPQKYRKFPLIRRDSLSPNVYRLVFGLPRSTDGLGLPTGTHVAIRADINGKAASRSYTPTSNDKDLGRIELIVKVYPGGLISNYLATRELGDLVEFRGPKGSMKYHRDLCKNLGMIAGGTGITPMFQLIRAICEDPNDNTKVTLLYGNQSDADILLRHELEGFERRFPKKLSVWHVLVQAPEGWKYGTGFVTKELIKEKFGAPSSDFKVHLCGPPGMINAMKTNLVELGFEAPGVVSKITDQVFIF
ncbi:related to cytochrome b5 [Phialocephala subalpina]|uniref:Related to cytochrome b5 n=1 Tax=Phialocephala subalpina TaxID=576137 RepID=A0A1L7WMA3_9HELO|nr:related to cytochrome b5 [Phialocephala subalpina]